MLPCRLLVGCSLDQPPMAAGRARSKPHCNLLHRSGAAQDGQQLAGHRPGVRDAGGRAAVYAGGLGGWVGGWMNGCFGACATARPLSRAKRTGSISTVTFCP